MRSRRGGKFDVNGCNSMRRTEQAPFNPLWANVQEVTAEHWTSDSVVLTAVAGLLTARSTTSLANYLQFTTKVASGASLSSSLVLDIHCSPPLRSSNNTPIVRTKYYEWFFSCNFSRARRIAGPNSTFIPFGLEIIGKQLNLWWNCSLPSFQLDSRWIVKK